MKKFWILDVKERGRKATGREELGKPRDGSKGNGRLREGSKGSEELGRPGSDRLSRPGNEGTSNPVARVVHLGPAALLVATHQGPKAGQETTVLAA